MLGYRLLLVGVFLTPAARLMVVPGVGFSFGDVFLIAGSMLLMTEQAAAAPQHRNAGTIPFLAAGSFAVFGVLLSGIVRQSAPLGDVASLALQYAVVLWLLPLSLSHLTRKQMERCMWALVLGFTWSVIIGLAIVFGAPQLATTLQESGRMVILAGDRHGFFTGVGELAGLASLLLPLIYYLMVRGEIGQKRAAFALFGVGLAVVASRAASGIATIAAVALILLLLHGLTRRQEGGERRTGAARMATVAGLSLGVVVYVARRLGGPDSVDLVDRFVQRLIDPLSAGGVSRVGSAETRGALVTEGWAKIGEMPILGTGPGLYRQTTASGHDVHVVPVMMWAESGLIPVFGWLVLVVGVAIGLLRSWRAAPNSTVPAAAVLAGTVVWHFAAAYMYPRLMMLPLLLTYLVARSEAMRKTPPDGGLEVGVKKRTPPAPGEPALKPP